MMTASDVLEVLTDGQGREVDLHPLTPTAGGGGDQALPGGGSFHSPPPTLGVIGGQQVACVDADTQVPEGHARVVPALAAFRYRDSPVRPAAPCASGGGMSRLRCLRWLQVVRIGWRS
jgi:hypothetical protein